MITPEVVSSFVTPGGAIQALAWGDGSLWLADENSRIYRLDAQGQVQSSFTHSISSLTDLSWFENTLWAHNGNAVYKLDSTGQIVETLAVGYWAFSGMEWVEGELYVGDYNSSDIHKHDRTGTHIFSWPTTGMFGHPVDMVYDGSSLWITDSCEGGQNSIFQYSLTGQPGNSIDVRSIDTCTWPPDRGLAWDGRYLWFAGRLDVYQLNIGGDDVPPVASVVAPSGGEYWLLSDAGSTPNTEVITWAMSDNVRICQVRVSLWYSNDGGATYQEAPAGGGLPATFGPGGSCTGAGELTTSLTYTIPVDPPSGTSGSLYKIQVEVTDAAGNTLATDPDSGLAAVRSTNPFYIVRPNPDSVRTLILKNTARMQSVMGITSSQAAALDLKLQELADHPRVQGLVVDLGAVTDLSELYAAWDADPTNSNKANAVLFGCHPPYPTGCPTDRERRGIHDQIRNLLVALDYEPAVALGVTAQSTYSGVRYLVLVGDDGIIPMARIRDRTVLLPESSYPAGGDIRSLGTRVGEALADGKYLSDDPLAVLDRVSATDLAASFFLPDLAVGRLVETPEEMTTTIATYISQDGILDLSLLDHKVLITGYDFLTNVAKVMRSRWKASLGVTTSDDSIAPVAGNLIGDSWGLGSVSSRKTALRTALSGNGGAPYGVMAIAGHATHFDEGVPGTDPFDIQGLSSADIYGADSCSTPTLGSINMAGGVIYAAGCHGGLPVPGSCRTDSDRSLDLPQTFLSRGVVAYVANSGYGWGLKYGIGYGARLLQIFTEQVTSSGTIAVGDAVRLSKQRYFLETPRYDAYDEKSAMQWTLFGLPMYALKTGTAGTTAATVQSVEGERLEAVRVTRTLAGQGASASRSARTTVTATALPPYLTQLSLSFDFTAEGVYEKHDSSGAVLPSGPGCPDTNGCYYTLQGLVDRGSGSGDLPIQPYLIYDSRLSGTSQHGVLWKGGTYDEETDWQPIIAELVSNGGDGSNHGSTPLTMMIRPTAPRVVPGLDLEDCRPADLELSSITLAAGEAVKPASGGEVYSIARRYRNIDLEIFYFNNSTTPADNCDRAGPSLDPGPYGGQYHQVSDGSVEWAVPATDPAGVWRVVIVYTTNTVDGEGRGRWTALDLANDGAQTFHGSAGMSGVSRLTYVIQAVDNRGNITWLDYVSAQLPASGVPLGVPEAVEVFLSGSAAAPTGVDASATTSTSVTVMWNDSGAASYEVYRRAAAGGFAKIGSSDTNSYPDSAASAGTAYLYAVKSIDSLGFASELSVPDLATTVVFTDPSLTPGITTAKSAHVTELRMAVDAVRTLAGLGAYAFSDAIGVGVTIRAIDIEDLRTALDAARAQLALSAVSYTDPILAAQATLIRAVHIDDLRNGVK
ncbi:MAG TPA: hypothetical protein VNA04_03155 [Thermoanaerobaculia bacterium]|nr:hypothetical protein [Thermoanaerobaculia bacterium]